MSDDKKTKTDGAAAKIRGLDTRVTRIESWLEQQVGFDINKDGVIGGMRVALLLMLAIGCIASLAYGVEVLRVNGSGTSMIQYEQDSDGIPNGSMTIVGTLTAAAVAADVTGDLVGGVTLTVTSANWTDGSTNSLLPGINLISGTGGANDSTNTVVLVAPTVAGQVAYIVIATASTNLISIAEGTTFSGSGTLLLDADDAAILVAPSTVLWIETPGNN